MALSKFALCLWLCTSMFLVCTQIFSLELDPQTRALQEADRVISLPSQLPMQVLFRQYSGYVTVDKSNEKALFYWFFEATSKPAQKPLILWLNGGIVHYYMGLICFSPLLVYLEFPLYVLCLRECLVLLKMRPN